MDTKLYTISEVADKLGLSSKTLRRWEETGKFVGTRTLGGQRRYSLQDLQVLDAIKHGTIPSSRDLLSLQEAAQFFGVSTSTINRWEEEGKIHPLITAGTVYYPRSRLKEKRQELMAETTYQQPQYEFVHVEPDPEVEPPLVQPAHQVAKAPRIKLKPLPVPKLTTSNNEYLQILLNIVITSTLIALYHFAFARPSANIVPLADQGSVQGVDSNQEAKLALLDKIIDKTGNLRALTLSSSSLSLTPSNKPAKATPGDIYFDAGSQTLKLYSGDWTDLTASTIGLNNEAIVGASAVPAGSSSLRIDQPQVSEDSSVILTFTSDFAPAKKFWLSKGQGFFVVNLDYPTASKASFDYMIFAPVRGEELEPEPVNNSPVLDSLIR